MGSRLGAGAAFGGSAVPTVTGATGDVNGEINVTPMIDVMLVLLIIFMVITPALAGYAADLPDAVTAAPEKDDRVTLGIDREGRLYLDERPAPVPAADLQKRLELLYRTRPDDHVLYLKADQNVSYAVVLSAMDAARAAGVRRIGAITERAGTSPAKER